MPSTRPSITAAILGGGFIAGTLDIGAASLITGKDPIWILKFIAGGLLGKESLAGGASNAVTGLLLQWGMSIIIAAVFVLAMRGRAALTRSWLYLGLAYGAVVFAVMNYVVLPLSAWHVTPKFGLYGFTTNFAAMLLFGCIIAYMARRVVPARVL